MRNVQYILTLIHKMLIIYLYGEKPIFYKWSGKND